MASIVFACLSLFLFRTYGQVHWIPSRYSTPDNGELFQRVLADVGPIRDQVHLAYLLLAAAALFWCIWSWISEPRLASIIATVFTALAVFRAVFIVI